MPGLPEERNASMLDSTDSSLSCQK